LLFHRRRSLFLTLSVSWRRRQGWGTRIGPCWWLKPTERLGGILMHSMADAEPTVKTYWNAGNERVPKVVNPQFVILIFGRRLAMTKGSNPIALVFVVIIISFMSQQNGS
jgi:hypothetical protein